MRWRFRVWAVPGLLCAIRAASWQSVPSGEIAVIKQKMAQNLARIPNYTCLETITRSRRAPNSLVIAAHGKPVPFLRADVVRLEVAEVKGDELYARAGDHVFRTRNIEELVGTGLIGNGVFALFLHDIFATNIAQFQARGNGGIAGETPRYDFRVPSLVSGFLIATELGKGVAGYHGAFYTDPRTVDSLRLEVESDDMAVYTGIKTASIRIDYSTVRIGSSEVLLPQSAEMATERDDGWGSLNEMAFTHCREYGVETSISFDESGGGGAETTTAVTLPPDLELTISLVTPIDTNVARVGDDIDARVDVDAKRKGVVVVPGGAALRGRIRSIARHKEQGSTRIVLGLEFMELEYPGRRARFFASLQKIEMPGVQSPRLKVVSKDAVLPGVGEITAAGDRMVLPTGAQMLWKTAAY